MTVKSLFFMGLALWVTSCTDTLRDSSSEKPALSPREIRIAASQTVIDGEAAGDTCFPAGEHLWFFVQENSQPKRWYYGAWAMRTTGTALLESVSQVPHFFPETGNSINIYGIHGNFKFTEGDAWPDSVVQACDSIQTVTANYRRSDLSYGIAPRQTSRKAVFIPFYHMLSKIMVAFKVKDYQNVDYLTDEDFEGATLTINNVLDTCVFNMDTAEGRTKGRRVNITVPFSLVPRTQSDFSKAAYGMAVIPPQIVRKDSVFMTVTLKRGTKITYKPTYDFRLETGKCYRFDMLMKADETLPPDSVIAWQDDPHRNIWFASPIDFRIALTDWNSTDWERIWDWQQAIPADSLEKYTDEQFEWTNWWRYVSPWGLDSYLEQNYGTKPQTWRFVVPQYLSEWNTGDDHSVEFTWAFIRPGALEEWKTDGTWDSHNITFDKVDQ
ncbi:MAG: fimbrillin family protein [Prevotella sp.]|nr:fimbrillin family protein [Prevotella sp.]